MIVQIGNRLWVDPLHIESVQIVNRDAARLEIAVNMTSGAGWTLPRDYRSDTDGELEAETDAEAVLSLIMRAKREPDVIGVADARPHKLHVVPKPPGDYGFEPRIASPAEDPANRL